MLPIQLTGLAFGDRINVTSAALGEAVPGLFVKVEKDTLVWISAGAKGYPSVYFTSLEGLSIEKIS